MTEPKQDEDDAYLWDRSDPIDPAVARLEKTLAPLRHDAPLLASLPKREKKTPRAAVVVVAASLAIAAVVTWLVLRSPETRPRIATPTPTPADSLASCAVPSRGSHGFRTHGGAARCGSRNHETGFLPLDGVLETPPGSTATVDIADLGTITVEPESKLRLVAADKEKQTLDLVRGSLHAKISAPPRLFIVKTAAADAVDLGCEYTLRADEVGNGTLTVSYGSVSLERPGLAPTFVAEGTTCRIGPRGPGTPLAQSASEALRRAADDLDDGDASAFDRVVGACGAGDTITLWHLMQRVDGAKRGRAWDRLSRHVPPPKTAPRDAVVKGERSAIADYYEVLIPIWFKR